MATKVRAPVVVIGAGQAGLAAGRMLQKAGLDFLILEAGDRASGSWRAYYDSLTLFSPTAYSALPDRAMPGDPNAYPCRDAVADYLEDYAAHFALPIRFAARVASADPDNESDFVVRLESGEAIAASAVVAATGTFGSPHMPAIEGAAGFGGTVLHSAAYRRPTDFAGQRVIVVGAANSAVQIAAELAALARVTLATREAIRYAPQRLLGRDVHFFFKWLGIDATNIFSDQGTPVLDDGRYRLAIAEGRPERRQMFKAMTTEGVIWADGREEPVDAILFATGFRPDLPFLPAAAFSPDGKLKQRGGASTAIDRLYFVGQPGLTRFASGVLRGVGHDAAAAVRRIKRRLAA
ncbi:flavin-containing monooxygenase [Sphingopyxis sp. OPL5]|uniref:flavin-containing monooxygenase n=1 Tax=Sphingopyxis sp. OPL5 TaxID=2486273 RepID=UPI001CA45033|nr:NAD(P)/FAD-dependent oxidoreductase [Sphingopyxis sp. OPL5]